jgi:hypothetical protein
VAIPHPSNETYSLSREELGNTSSSPRASIISIPKLFTYALYIMIAFVLEVIYLAITLLLVLLSISESANFVSLVFCVLDNNIRKFKCVLSVADFTAQRLAMSLGLF